VGSFLKVHSTVPAPIRYPVQFVVQLRESTGEIRAGKLVFSRKVVVKIRNAQKTTL